MPNAGDDLEYMDKPGRGRLTTSESGGTIEGAVESQHAGYIGLGD